MYKNKGFTFVFNGLNLKSISPLYPALLAFLSRPAKEIAKVDSASKCAPQWEVLGSVKELVKPGEVGRAHPTSGRPWSVVGAAGNS